MNQAIEQLKQFYSQQNQKDRCLKLSRDKAFRQIVLIRHGKPIVKKPLLVSYKAAEKYLWDYHHADIHPITNKVICTENIRGLNIYHSNVNRARVTAQSLFPENEFKLIEDERYRELERKNVKALIPLPHFMHTHLSRLAWIAGLMKDIEGPAAARERINQNAEHLVRVNSREPLLILVAHGFHNYFLKRKLTKFGYKVLKNDGKSHLGVFILAKAID